jgi:two-component system, NarL family, response regulator NreC
MADSPKRLVTKPRPPRILIADDHELFRTGVASVLSRSRKYAVCALANDEREVFKLSGETQPELLLLDLFLGNRDGIALIKDFSGRFPEIGILVLSDRLEPTFAERVLEAGASGYVMKSASSKQLLEAVKQVLRGQTYVTPRDRLLSQHSSVDLPQEAEADLRTLTDRELHVFQLIGLGLGTGRVAVELGLSRKTIEGYKERIKNKLGYANANALSMGAEEWFSGANGTRPSASSSE